MNPSTILKRVVGRSRYPPRNAAGMESNKNGHVNFQKKCPPLQNCQNPMLATMMFKLNAMGLISAGAMLNNDITAIYPDAPAWPTDEYKKATTPIASVTSMMISTDIMFKKWKKWRFTLN